MAELAIWLIKNGYVKGISEANKLLLTDHTEALKQDEKHP